LGPSGEENLTGIPWVFGDADRVTAFLYDTGSSSMNDAINNDKSFSPQPFPPGEPTNEWGADQLGCYAHVLHQQIEAGEKLLTPAYWRLGKALYFAKKSFGHGQWMRFLQSWGIDKTRAAKARAIYGAFDSDEAVQSISVEQAYQQRLQQPAKAEPAKGHRGSAGQSLGRFTRKVCKQAESLVDEAAFIEPQQALDLLPQLEEAIEGLRRLRQWLQSQAETAGQAAVDVMDPTHRQILDPQSTLAAL
jgi:hypothetical protein